jgi:hypothetical protein
VFTHRGWFGVCPVYIGDTYTQAPTLVERRAWLRPLYVFSEALQGLCCAVLSRLDPEFEPGWAIMITGELDPPIADADLPRW